MKKIIAIVLAAALIMSLFTIGAYADADTGNLCKDLVEVRDAAGNKISSIKIDSYGDMGDIGGKGAASIVVRGWFADYDEFTDIGWSTNDGEIQWGAGFERPDLNETNTGKPYYMGLNLDMTVGEGTSCSTKIYANYVEGAEEIYEYTYVNKTTDVAVERNVAVLKDGDLLIPQTISVADKNESGKDWVGIFSASADINNLTEADFLGYKKYVDGGSIEFTLANLKQEGAKDITSGKYIIALLENDSYTVLASTTVNFVTREETAESLVLTAKDILWTSASGECEPDEDTGDVYVAAAAGAQAWVQADISDYVDDPADYPYGILVVDFEGESGHVGFYTNVGGSKMENDTKLVAGTVMYTFPVDEELDIPTFPFFNDFGEATIKALCFFTTYEEYQYYLENGTAWTDVERIKPTEVPATATPEPTEVPTLAPTDAATDAPADATKAPSSDNEGGEKAEKKDGNTGLVIGIVAAAVVIAAVVAAVVIIKKKKK